MGIILSLIQLITILIICIYEYKKQQISIFMWATLLIMFGLPHLISVVFNYSTFNDQILYQASAFVIGFNIVYLTTKIFIDLVLKSENNEPVFFSKVNNHFSNRDKKLVNTFIILLCISLLIILYVSIVYFGGIENSSWGKFYMLNVELGFNSPIKYADIIFFTVAGVALVLRSNKNKYMFLFTAGLIITYSIVTSNRITILPAFMAIIIPIIFSQSKRVSIKKILYFSLIGFLAVYSVYFLRLVRIAGGVTNFFKEFHFKDINSTISEMLLNGDGELGLRNAFYYFISINNNFPGFNEAATYIRILLIGIPTRLIENIKPPDFAITMGSAYTNNLNNTRYSMHPTLYGDVFANLWWFGILLAIFWAIFTYAVTKLAKRNNFVMRNMLLSLFGTMFVIIGRGSVYNGVFIGIQGALLLFLLYYLSQLSMKSKLKYN
ncbi:O-antigen polymerase [Exiguobacterium sp. NPDC077395]|uniref:O-antigen polymerase n=1 Tax=Exiguobacterium sp. NPDC077395 TaxID=3390563 RepID=UPI003D027F41